MTGFALILVFLIGIALGYWWGASSKKEPPKGLEYSDRALKNLNRRR